MGKCSVFGNLLAASLKIWGAYWDIKVDSALPETLGTCGSSQHHPVPVALPSSPSIPQSLRLLSLSLSPCGSSQHHLDPVAQPSITQSLWFLPASFSPWGLVQHHSDSVAPPSSISHPSSYPKLLPPRDWAVPSLPPAWSLYNPARPGEFVLPQATSGFVSFFDLLPPLPSHGPV